MSQLYRPIIKQAVIISWRYKFLWLFGFFATALIGAGNFEIITQALQTMGGQGFSLMGLNLFFTNDAFRGLTLSKLVDFIIKNPLEGLLVLLTFLVLLVITILVVWLAIVSVGALIHSVGKLYRKQKINFSDSLEKGIVNFWPVLGVNVLAKIITLILFFIVSIPIFLMVQKGSWFNALFYLILFILMVGLAVIIAFLTIFAEIYIILERKSIGASIKASWKLFQKNWLISIETGIILLLINFIFGFILFAILAVLSIPWDIILIVFASSQSVIGYTIFLAAGLLFLVAAIILAGSFLSTFQFAVWTILFLNIQKEVQSKIMRLTKGWGLHK